MQHTSTPSYRLQRWPMATIGTALAATAAMAREPGVLPTIPQGATMGVPIAAPSPLNGIFLSSRSGFSSQRLYDANGDKTATKLQIKDTVLQFAFVPGTKVLGGQYRAFLSLPYIDVEGKNIPTPFGPADSHNKGIGSVEIRPFDASWELSPGIFVNAGASVFAPGHWDANKLANPAGNFWTFSPSVGASYMRNGWNASAHLLHFTHGRNRDDHYGSGDEMQLNMTAMKQVQEGLSLGVVAYLRKQITSDTNPAGAYGGVVSGRSEAAGFGLSATQQWGPVNFNVTYSTDFRVRNTGGGNRLWLNFIVPLKVEGM